jgi:hypothetical protein
MVETSQAAEAEARTRSISRRLLRLIGLPPVETLPLEPAALEAVTACYGLTSFIGLPMPTLVPGVVVVSEVEDVLEAEPPSSRGSIAGGIQGSSLSDGTRTEAEGTLAPTAVDRIADGPAPQAITVDAHHRHRAPAMAG